MKIIIIGCGRVGTGLAKMLSNRGHDITVVDNTPEAFDSLGPNFKGKTVCGIGFDKEVLQHAGIDKCDALAAVTASDEANVVAARMAKKFFKVPRVAARIYDPRKAEVYRRFGLQIICPVTLGISSLAELLTFTTMNTITTIGSGEVNCVEVEVPQMLVGHTVEELDVAGEIRVMTITRNGKTFLPTPGTMFTEYDQVHLAVLIAASDRLKKMLS
jgi:trk system potassium uptake protein TrkA